MGPSGFQPQPINEVMRLMDYYDNVARHFQHHIEHLSLSVDAIADILGNVAERIQQALLSEKKVFSCGIGLDASTAILFSELMTHGLSRERPVLPTVELASRFGALPDSGQLWLSGQLQAQGQPGDVALIFAGSLDKQHVSALATTINRREIQSIWIGAQGPGASLTFPGSSPACNLALCHASVICLAELIDIMTFGPLEDMP